MQHMGMIHPKIPHFLYELPSMVVLIDFIFLFQWVVFQTTKLLDDSLWLFPLIVGNKDYYLDLPHTQDSSDKSRLIGMPY